MTNFTCRCCGHRTLPEEPPGTWFDCPVCGYRDESDGRGDLVGAQDYFQSHGACEEFFLQHVRAPNPDEPRDPDWIPLTVPHARDKQKLVEIIDAAFDNVILGDGTSLEDAHAIDMYRDRDPDSLRSASWRDVSDDEIMKFDCLSFLDEKGMRFYLPAFMMHLVRASPSFAVSDDQYLMFALARGRTEQRFSMLNKRQIECVRAFLAFVGTYHSAWYQDEVKPALKGW